MAFEENGCVKPNPNFIASCKKFSKFMNIEIFPTDLAKLQVPNIAAYPRDKFCQAELIFGIAKNGGQMFCLICAPSREGLRRGNRIG
ncbi:hypothetical protein AGR1C_Cc40033 [Agrobacterium fabacearum TT111]|nr:hypothetical protein AGR1C_Cc40033 [Agrobacterium fabacearum TT111]